MFQREKLGRVLKVLVPVKGARADDDAIRLACALVRKDKGKVYVVYVIKVKRALPLDVEIRPEIIKAEEILEHAEECAEEQDCGVETDLLQAREIGPAIVEEAVERGVDMIVMGIDYKRRFGEFSLGEALPYVLKNAPCPVLAYREPIGEGK